ncbi:MULTISPECIES: carbohydrate ABC transporter permease [Nocardiopsis]|uniref:Binding-protein-dependent transport systems inner membrane component n=1 Tax=Nocardiopsis dassonvillei (strain ATCC 23218 / DSM 43111 / CIP 107115 / JCM 7437 / KCTC 9190 / NBRC 14626 / NCTC 10488 / NRRL B-5397 / IMRU 509) TaxID=446468 RepID=D7AXD3_NOCDD|nr:MULTISPECIES: carbohydrate ABC transporter permease [Nocardiopsis]ADH66007.1 binding-protein-dependent transport systems inner membrane component [Nocardiopsis dassonvillei subsp. dassonvillei DSM 43111]APC34346.1 sugar ABC transporter permease [Nocardiopsis dassonvillei]NKY79027.1 carbohydrate ABC transporter permease [Nocardiopsis dassonvillei]VEI92028.1 Inner membrane ABC transporter permease protein ycjP [Nocardiopsis dassonvillei]
MTEAPTVAGASGPRQRRRRPRTAILKHGALLLFLVVMVYPLVWMVVSAFKPAHLILTEPGLVPTEVTFENFREGWHALNQPFSVFFVNSLVVTVGSILGNLVSCSLAAYALARLEFRARRLFFGITLVTVMLPMHVLIIPQYIFFAQLGWVDTYLPLLIPKLLATDAFFVFLMVQFIRGIPRDLDRAAEIDGAGHFRIFWHVILPLMRPALVTTTIFTFIWTWNDFFTPLIYLTSTDMYTVPVALSSMVSSESQQGIGMLFAMSLISLLPVILFFVFAQRYLIRGMVTSGLK